MNLTTAHTPRRCATDASEPTQNDESTEEDPIDADYGDLLVELGELDDDEEEARDLDPGVNVETPNDINSDEDDTSETAFAVEMLFPESPTADLDLDEASVDNLGFETIELPRAHDTNDDESELPFEQLLESALPPMDADPSEEQLIEPVQLELEASTEKRNIAWSERRYVEIPTQFGANPYYLLIGEGEMLYAAGKTVLEVSRDVSLLAEPAHQATTVAELRHSALSLIPLGGRKLLCVTAAGQMLLLESTGTSRKVTHHLEPGEYATEVEAAQLTSSGNTVRVLLANGSIVRSDDGAATFRAEPTRSPMLRLASGSTPIGLARDRGKPLWAFVQDEWQEREITSEPLKRFLDSMHDAAVLLATAGDVILLGERERGVWVSTDKGAHFEFLAGSNGVTALWSGNGAEQPVAFLATTRAVEGVIEVLQIDFDKRELTRVIELSPSEGREERSIDDTSEDDDGVNAIHYDSETQTLWLAGSFGLKRFALEPIQ